MARTKLYTAIFVVLFALSTVQAYIEMLPIFETSYWLAFGIIITVAMVKGVIVAAYYQHLRWEPISVTYLMLTGLAAVLALTLAAAYSIT